MPADISLPSPACQQSDEIREILNSKSFGCSTTLYSLLIYLWDHRHENISEYAIAIDALGRKTNFDPKYDSTVRVHISRLRKRLREFYEGEGSHLRSRIEIPMGTHTIRIVEVEEPDQNHSSHSDLSVSEPATAVREPRFRWGMAIFFLLSVGFLAGGCAAFLWKHGFAKQEAAISFQTPQLPAFWREELNNGKPTRLVICNPTFFQWKNASSDELLARDPNINDFSTLNRSAYLASLKKEYGNPEVNQGFITAPDAFALVRLVQYFDSYGLQMPFYGSSDSPTTLLDHQNLIVFGNDLDLAPYGKYLDSLTFKMNPRRTGVVDEKPLPGQPHQFDWVRESNTHRIIPGIIAVLPGSNSGTRIMIIMATYDTASLVDYVISEEGLRELESARMKQGSNPFFEAVVLTEINGEVRLKSRLAELKPLPR